MLFLLGMNYLSGNRLVHGLKHFIKTKATNGLALRVLFKSL